MKFEYLYQWTGVVILIKQLYNSPFHLIKVFSVKTVSAGAFYAHHLHFNVMRDAASFNPSPPHPASHNVIIFGKKWTAFLLFKTKKLQGSQWEQGINREEKCDVMLPW